jgi:hypothetical protein
METQPTRRVVSTRLRDNTTPVDLTVDGNEYAEMRDRLAALQAEVDRLCAELALALAVVDIFRGKTWTKRGDELCVYATADDVVAIRAALAE